MDVKLLMHGGANGVVNYTLYRRYSQFLALYTSLEAALGSEALLRRDVAMPEKEKMGGYYSTFKIIVDKRMITLQKFITSVLANIDNVELQSCFQEFFDVKSRGASGAQRALGEKAIVKEVLALVKPGLTLLDSLMWQSCFVVLTTPGQLFILRSMYDDLASPIVLLPVGNGNAIANSCVGNSLVTEVLCKHNGKKTLLKFSSVQEQATWVRAITDVSLSMAAGVGNSSIALTMAVNPTVATGRPLLDSSSSSSNMGKNAADRGAAASGVNSNALVGCAPAEEIKAKGTGNTSDYLSSFGL